MGKATDKCRNSVMVLGFTHPHFLLIHSKIRDNYLEQKGGGGVGTMAMTSTGRILIDPDFVEKLDRDECAGVLAHEMLHLILQHHGRKGGRDAWTWNIAADMAINNALQQDGIKLPKDCVTLPSEYQGDIFTEAIFEWLLKHPQKVPPQPKSGQASPTAGCGIIEEEGKEGVPDWKQVAIEARALAQSVGKGTTGVAALLSPRTAKISWKKVIRHGFQMACAEPGRDYQTFQKRHRRSPVNGPQFPGWMGYKPRIAEAIDVSGSMDREWINQVVSETKNLMKQFTGVRVYLVAHTSEVVWEGWVDQSTQAKIDEAVNFSGGTDPTPAYEAIRKQGMFDALIHFTDCEFFGSDWPKLPVKKANQLVVGSFVREPSTKPPPGSHVIFCEVEGRTRR